MYIVYGWQLNIRHDRVFVHFPSAYEHQLLTLGVNESVWLVPGTLND